MSDGAKIITNGRPLNEGNEHAGRPQGEDEIQRWVADHRPQREAQLCHPLRQGNKDQLHF